MGFESPLALLWPDYLADTLEEVPFRPFRLKPRFKGARIDRLHLLPILPYGRYPPFAFTLHRLPDGICPVLGESPVDILRSLDWRKQQGIHQDYAELPKNAEFGDYGSPNCVLNIFYNGHQGLFMSDSLRCLCIVSVYAFSVYNSIHLCNI